MHPDVLGKWMFGYDFWIISLIALKETFKTTVDVDAPNIFIGSYIGSRSHTEEPITAHLHVPAVCTRAKTFRAQNVRAQRSLWVFGERLALVAFCTAGHVFWYGHSWAACVGVQSNRSFRCNIETKRELWSDAYNRKKGKCLIWGVIWEQRGVSLVIWFWSHINIHKTILTKQKHFAYCTGLCSSFSARPRTAGSPDVWPRRPGLPMEPLGMVACIGTWRNIREPPRYQPNVFKYPTFYLAFGKQLTALCWIWHSVKQRENRKTNQYQYVF